MAITLAEVWQDMAVLLGRAERAEAALAQTQQRIAELEAEVEALKPRKSRRSAPLA